MADNAKAKLAELLQQIIDANPKADAEEIRQQFNLAVDEDVDAAAFREVMFKFWFNDLYDDVKAEIAAKQTRKLS
ncbi:MAG TPA: hypothetical protein VMW68_00790 [Methyloceanibacter sp.]|nr:hypothetical protein [Methyloceanibacter sp.]